MSQRQSSSAINAICPLLVAARSFPSRCVVRRVLLPIQFQPLELDHALLAIDRTYLRNQFRTCDSAAVNRNPNVLFRFFFFLSFFTNLFLPRRKDIERRRQFRVSVPRWIIADRQQTKCLSMMHRRQREWLALCERNCLSVAPQIARGLIPIRKSGM